MQKIIFDHHEMEQLPYSELSGEELIAYPCQNSDSYAVLTKLGHGKYGFIGLNTSTGNPRYVGGNWFEAVKKAGSQRPLFKFENMNEMLKVMHDGSLIKLRNAVKNSVIDNKFLHMLVRYSGFDFDKIRYEVSPDKLIDYDPASIYMVIPNKSGESYLVVLK